MAASTQEEMRAAAGITTGTFTGLTDTPSTYTGQALKSVRVNAGETALEFSTPSGLSNFTEALTTAAPNDTITVASLTTTGSATNIDIALLPKGTGAILADIPDNTSTGGNKRGSRAVDLQRQRTNNTQVASGGNAILLGGANNTASGSHTQVIGGANCSSTGSYSFVICSSGSSANGSSGVLGGSNNSASSAPQRSIIIAGSDNLLSGDYTSIIAGYSCSLVQGSFYSTIVGGVGNTLTGAPHSSIIAGSDNYNADAYCAILGGQYGITRGAKGAEIRGMGRFSTIGDSQRVSYMLRRISTDATPVGLTASLVASPLPPSPGERIDLPNNHAYKFTAQVIAREPATGDVKSWDVTGTIKRGANAAATTLVGTPTVTVQGEDAGAVAWSLAVTADTSAGGLSFTGTGEASHTIRWLAHIQTIEIG